MPTTNKLLAKQIEEPEFPSTVSKECSNSCLSNISFILPEETLLSLLFGYPTK